MLIKVDLLTLISDNDVVTAYFFDRDSKIIFVQRIYSQKQLGELDLKLFSTLIKTLEAEILYFELRNELECTWLYMLTKDRDITKIEIPLKTMVSFAGLCEIPIFIQHDLLYKEGITVTKRLIEDTLQH